MMFCIVVYVFGGYGLRLNWASGALFRVENFIPSAQGGEWVPNLRVSYGCVLFPRFAGLGCGFGMCTPWTLPERQENN